ncbi:MAG TPA: glycosyltransferase [Puia sp.]|nr:glycosyltransferase [Puia sp.]
MKICLISKECYPFFYGGIGTAFYSLGKLLSAQGHDVVHLARKPAEFDQQAYDRHYDDHFRMEWINYSEGDFSTHTIIDYSFQLEKHFEHFSNSYTADIVIYPEYDGEAFFLVQGKNSGKKKYSHIPFAVHFSGPLFCLFEAETRIATDYERIIFEMEAYCIRASSYSIAPSSYIWNILHNKFDLGHQLNFIVPNPINPEFFPWPEAAAILPEGLPTRNILFIGRLQKTKGADLLVKAFKDIVGNEKGNEDIRLQLVGKDIYWDEYDTSFIDYWKSHLPENVLSKIDFVGHISQSDIRELLRTAWVAVFPSRFEVFGNVALEAIYRGTPILVNRQTGLADVAGKDYGLFWAGEEDPEDLVRQLKRVLTTPDLRNELSRQSHRRALEIHGQLYGCFSDALGNMVAGKAGHSPVPEIPEVEMRLFTLINQYSTLRISEKNKEIAGVYEQKEKDLKTAWEAYDEKDKKILEVWRQYDEKEKSIQALQLRCDQLKEESERLVAEMAGIQERQILGEQAGEGLRKELEEKNARVHELEENIQIAAGDFAALQKTGEMLTEANELLKIKEGEQQERNLLLSRQLELQQEQTAAARQLCLQLQEELKSLKESHSYQLGLDLQRNKWARLALSFIFRKRKPIANEH